MTESEIKHQIEKNEKEIERLQHLNGALSVELFKKDFLFKEGDILIKDNRKVRFVKYGYILQYAGAVDCIFKVVNIKKDDTDGAIKNINHGFTSWRYFIA